MFTRSRNVLLRCTSHRRDRVIREVCLLGPRPLFGPRTRVQHSTLSSRPMRGSSHPSASHMAYVNSFHNQLPISPRTGSSISSLLPDTTRHSPSGSSLYTAAACAHRQCHAWVFVAFYCTMVGGRTPVVPRKTFFDGICCAHRAHGDSRSATRHTWYSMLSKSWYRNSLVAFGERFVDFACFALGVASFGHLFSYAIQFTISTQSGDHYVRIWQKLQS